MSNEEGDKSSFPKAGELLDHVQANNEESNNFQFNLEQQMSSSAVKSETEWVHLSGLEDHYRHKGNWSLFLMALLTCMIVFQSFLLWMVGAGYWDFSKYKWLLPALLVQNLGQIIALAYVVVKSFFK